MSLMAEKKRGLETPERSNDEIGRDDLGMRYDSTTECFLRRKETKDFLSNIENV